MKIRVFHSLADTVEFCFQSPFVVVFCVENNSFWTGVPSDSSPSGNIYVELRYVLCNSELGSDNFYNEGLAFRNLLQEEYNNA